MLGVTEGAGPFGCAKGRGLRIDPFDDARTARPGDAGRGSGAKRLHFPMQVGETARHVG